MGSSAGPAREPLAGTGKVCTSVGASIDGDEGGVAAGAGAGRLTVERAVPPGVHGGRGVDVQPASIAITVNIAVDTTHACERGWRTRTPDSAASELSAFGKRCLDASRIMDRPFFTAQMFESTLCALQ